MLSVEPNEIVFAVDPSKKMLQTIVTVRNLSETDTLGFFVKTTMPAKYAVRPPQGVIAPRQAVDVQVLMSNKKPPVALGVQRQDKFLFHYGPVPLNTGAQEVKDVLKGQDDSGNLQGLKLKVRLRDLPRAPSTISEGPHEGVTPQHSHTEGLAASTIMEEPGTPHSKPRGLSNVPSSPLRHRAEEAAALRNKVQYLKEECEELQRTTDQMRLHGAGPAGSLSTADALALSRKSTAGFSTVQVVLAALFALLLGVVSRVVGKEALLDLFAALGSKLSA